MASYAREESVRTDQRACRIPHRPTQQPVDVYGHRHHPRGVDVEEHVKASTLGGRTDLRRVRQVNGSGPGCERLNRQSINRTI
jgi:hypothetical protein